MIKMEKFTFYSIVDKLVDGRVAIGGSMALIAHKDPTVPAGYKPGDIDLCIESEEDLQTIHEELTKEGFKMSLDIPNPYMFTVRRQYKIGKEKFDFFVVPNVESLKTEIDGFNYCHPSIVWAARGFYAGVGSSKAYFQLVNGGLINNNPRPKMKLKTFIKRMIKDLKSVLS